MIKLIIVKKIVFICKYYEVSLSVNNIYRLFLNRWNLNFLFIISFNR